MLLAHPSMRGVAWARGREEAGRGGEGKRESARAREIKRERR